MVRLRNRYVVAELHFADKRKNTTCLTEASLMQGIYRSIRDLHGIQGVALSKSGLHASYLNRETNMAFIRMRRSAYEIVTSSLAIISSIEGESLGIRTLYTGATIRHCNIFLRRHQRRELELKYGSLKSNIHRKAFEQELANISVRTIPVFKKL